MVAVPEASRERIIKIGIEGAKRTVNARAEEPLAMKTSYFRAGLRRANVSSFAKVTYEQVLPGVDIVYHGSGDQLEFDFVVRPGADPSKIVMRYQGQDRLFVNDEGDLVIVAGEQRLVQHLPAVYQRTGDALRLVSGNYSVDGPGRVSFRLGPYDGNRPLVIDPVISYLSFSGGAGTDAAIAMRRDSQGFLYIAGNARSVDIPATSDAFQARQGGDQDVFVMKINPNVPSPNDIVSVTYLGGTGTDEVKAMVLDSQNRVLLVGSTGSTNFPTTTGAPQTVHGTDTDAFFVKVDFSQSGTSQLAYSTFFGGSGPESANAIALDALGNTYIAGYSGALDMPIKGNAVQQFNIGGWDSFLAIYDAFGTLTYSTFLGGSGTDIATGVAPLSDGSVVIAGNTTSNGFPFAGASFDATFHDGGGDIFLARIVPNIGLNGLIYGTYFGGDGIDVLQTMAVTADDKLILAGSTTSSDLPVTLGAIQPFGKGSADLFVAVLDINKPQGAALIYGTYLGGSDVDYLYGVNVKSTSNILLTGYTYSKDFPVTSTAFQPTMAGAPDAFVMKIDLTKAGGAGLIYSSYLGSARADIGYAAEEDGPAGTLYVTGSTAGNTFPVANPFARGNIAGDYDLFVIGFPSGLVSLSTKASQVDAEGGDGFSVLVSAAPAYDWNAESDADWLTIRDGAAGHGNGAVSYAVAANGGTETRTANLSVAGHRVTITQSGKSTN